MYSVCAAFSFHRRERLLPGNLQGNAGQLLLAGSGLMTYAWQSPTSRSITVTIGR
jgi:hypothetical protein